MKKSCPGVKIKLIARAWGDEPVLMFLYYIENTCAYVGRDGSTKVIGLPLDQVYLFHEGDFSRLQQAFKAGHAGKLVSLYQELAVKSVCNRYQDVLESLHGKENVTNSASASTGR